MNITGIIAEYNPLHNGHRYQLDWIRNSAPSGGVVVLMSGNFTQRGDLAVFDKYARAYLAVINGADLVLELPAVYSSSPAEIYASGAVRIMNSLGIIDRLCFGMEDPGKTGTAAKVAEELEDESPLFKRVLKKELEKGNSFITARSRALESVTGEDLSFMSGPNNILAVEYLREIIRLESGLRPVALERKKGENMMSATEIRRMLREGKDVSRFLPCSEEVKGKNPRSLDEYSFTLRNRLLTMSDSDFASFAGIEAGLENRIRKAVFDNENIEEMVDFISGKRYTKSRIRRILLHILLNYTNEQMKRAKKETPSFVKVLALNEKGREIIRMIKEKNSTDVILRYSKDYKKRNDFDRFVIEKNISSDNIYNLDIKKENLDFYRLPDFL